MKNQKKKDIRCKVCNSNAICIYTHDIIYCYVCYRERKKEFVNILTNVFL